MTLTLLPASASKAEAQPLFATSRNTHRDTLGPDVSRIAEMIRRPPMPWQRDFFDVAYELDPQTGQLWYREIVLLLMRQQGKSTATLAAGAHRAVAWEQRQNVIYTAQTRKAARRKWIGEHVEVLKASPFWRYIGDDGLRTTNGDEGMTFAHGNGSWWGIDAPTEQSGHGDTLGLALLDEYWWQTDRRLEQSFGPAMITIDDAQKWVVSAAGNSRSGPLKRKRDRGRERVELGLDSHTLYLEYAIPDDEDVYDPKVWQHRMPAVGHTISIASLQAEQESLDDDREWRRAYACQWQDDFGGNWIIPEQDWDGCLDSGSELIGDVHWSVDVAPDMTATAISVAGLRGDGVPHVEVVDHRPGTSWAPHRMHDLELAYGGTTTADLSGPIGSLLPRFREAGVDLQPISRSDTAKACGAFKDAVIDGRVRHLGQAELDIALAGADRGKYGDAWIFVRGRSLADICPLYSVTIAHWRVLQELEAAGYDPLAGIQ